MYAMAISNSFLSENSISEPGMKRMENIIYPLGAWVVQLSCLCIIFFCCCSYCPFSLPLFVEASSTVVLHLLTCSHIRIYWFIGWFTADEMDS